MPDDVGFRPNLGVLSAFQGVGNAISDAGKMGLMDAMETRRSKMEHELRMMAKGEDQAFAADQADIKSERDIEAATVKSDREVTAATVKHDRDMELQKLKNKGKSSTSNAENTGVYQKAGVSISASDMTDRYEAYFGLNSDAFVMPEGGIPTQDEWAKKEGWTLIGTVPPEPVVLAPDEYKTRYFAAFPDATEEEYQQDLERDTKAGKVKPQSAAPTTPEVAPDGGIMDAYAADAPTQLSDAEFAALKKRADAGDRDASIALYDAQQGYNTGSGKPNAADIAFAGQDAQPGALDAVKEEAEPKKPYQPWKENRRKTALENKRKELLKYKSKAPDKNRRGKSPTVDKAAKQVVAALKKGNIKMVSKDKLKLALNNQMFVDGLTEEQIQTIKDYLGQN